jgi:hypothetical protein
MRHVKPDRRVFEVLYGGLHLVVRGRLEVDRPIIVQRDRVVRRVGIIARLFDGPSVDNSNEAVRARDRVLALLAEPTRLS